MFSQSQIFWDCCKKSQISAITVVRVIKTLNLDREAKKERKESVVFDRREMHEKCGMWRKRRKESEWEKNK